MFNNDSKNIVANSQLIIGKNDSSLQPNNKEKPMLQKGFMKKNNMKETSSFSRSSTPSASLSDQESQEVGLPKNLMKPSTSKKAGNKNSHNQFNRQSLTNKDEEEYLVDDESDSKTSSVSRDNEDDIEEESDEHEIDIDAEEEKLKDKLNIDLKRDHFDGTDVSLSDIEEYYLCEIEQQCNTDLIK